MHSCTIVLHTFAAAAGTIVDKFLCCKAFVIGRKLPFRFAMKIASSATDYRTYSTTNSLELHLQSALC